MIDEEATFKKYGYRSGDLSHGSGKKVVAVCDGCKKVRVLSFQTYAALCHTCACKSSINRAKISAGSIGKHVGEKSSLWMGGKVEVVCKQCGGKYNIKQSAVSYSRFCSKKCKNEYRSEHYKGENHPSWQGGMTNCVCVYCGDDYLVQASLAGNSRFCSRKCQGKYRSEYLVGENSMTWKGGISFLPYCNKFNERFKEAIREKHGRKCYLCNTTEERNGRKLSVHHTNYLKECLCTDTKCEFVPLCIRCHTKTNGNRFFWQTLFTYALQYEEEYYSEPIPNLLISVDV